MDGVGVVAITERSHVAPAWKQSKPASIVKIWLNQPESQRWCGWRGCVGRVKPKAASQGVRAPPSTPATCTPLHPSGSPPKKKKKNYKKYFTRERLKARKANTQFQVCLSFFFFFCKCLFSFVKQKKKCSLAGNIAGYTRRSCPLAFGRLLLCDAGDIWPCLAAVAASGLCQLVSIFGM